MYTHTHTHAHTLTHTCTHTHTHTHHTHIQLAPFNPSMFGAALEEVMELQKEKFPDYDMPWVVTALADAVVQLDGPQTEGIFRYTST